MHEEDYGSVEGPEQTGEGTVIDLENLPEGVEVDRRPPHEVTGQADMVTGEIKREEGAEVQQTEIKVLLIREIEEGMKVAVSIPQPPHIFLHDQVYKVQRIRANGNVVLKKWGVWRANRDEDNRNIG